MTHLYGPRAGQGWLAPLLSSDLGPRLEEDQLRLDVRAACNRHDTTSAEALARVERAQSDLSQLLSLDPLALAEVERERERVTSRARGPVDQDALRTLLIALRSGLDLPRLGGLLAALSQAALGAHATPQIAPRVAMRTADLELYGQVLAGLSQLAAAVDLLAEYRREERGVHAHQRGALGLGAPRSKDQDEQLVALLGAAAPQAARALGRAAAQLAANLRALEREHQRKPEPALAELVGLLPELVSTLEGDAQALGSMASRLADRPAAEEDLSLLTRARQAAARLELVRDVLRRAPAPLLAYVQGVTPEGRLERLADAAAEAELATEAVARARAAWSEGRPAEARSLLVELRAKLDQLPTPLHQQAYAELIFTLDSALDILSGTARRRR